ncbi:primosomal protein N' [Candidatus Babeliales bacterium]|nr:primosomal protein N' [Candidatus Babeliales bacterium]
MLVHVRLLHYASKIFTYHVPDQWHSDIDRGVLVQVPLGKQIVPAVVEKIADADQTFSFAIRSISAVFPFPHDPHFMPFIAQVASYYQIEQVVLLKRLQLFLAETQVQEAVADVQVQDVQSLAQIQYTNEQQLACDTMMPAVEQQRHETFVLHGVTGSGKTEVYKKLIQNVLEQGKAAVVMLPEVSLALRFEHIFKKSFAQTLVVGFHSASTASSKKTLWQALLHQTPMIIVGVHLPVLLPIQHLGLIIVDEEHDHGYQEKKHPKLHSKDMAVLKASLYKVPIVLGSATPSLSTLWNVNARGWKLCSMTQRYAGAFPKIRLVSLKRGQKKQSGWLHNELYFALQDRLQRGEQAIVFLNRRGYSFFVQCPCSFVFECHQCSVSLTLHQGNKLVCHYCGYNTMLAAQCPTCHGHSDEFIKQGIGTQQVVALLQKLFPQARIARADLDTTSKKKSWSQTVEAMYDKQIDILVGTQSITKGYHFPGVTLVGVLWADLNLHFPIYNAAETTLQQLIQVAGRAGRQSHDSLVVIQSFDQHPIFDFIDETKYLRFYEHEIQLRAQAGYPPCQHIAEIEIKSDNGPQLSLDSAFIAQRMKEIIAQKGYAVDVLGPVQSLVYKIKKTYTYKVLLKSTSRIDMIKLFHELKQYPVDSKVYFTVDPVA